MGDRTTRTSKAVTALAVLGVLAVLVAVSAAFALVGPGKLQPGGSLQSASVTPKRFVESDDAASVLVDLAEENDVLLESVVPSVSATASVVASASLAATSTTTSATAGAWTIADVTGASGAVGAGGTTAASGAGGSSAGSGASGVGASGSGAGGSSGSGGTGGTGGTPPPPGTGTQPPRLLSARVTGAVRHEVWGTPLRDVRVSLTPGGTDETGSGGEYAIDSPLQLAGTSANYLLAVDASRSGLVSHGTLSRSLRLRAGDRTSVDFAVYHASESRGRDWRDADWWTGWRGAYSSAEMAAMLGKVRAASAEFSSLQVAGVDAVLSPRGGASSRAKARAEYLALWLDLAAARLGFEAPTVAWTVRGYGSGSAGTALSFARRMDVLFTSGADPNWGDVRRLCSGDALAR